MHHCFFINNPVTMLVSTLYHLKNRIPSNSIELFSVRGYPTDAITTDANSFDGPKGQSSNVEVLDYLSNLDSFTAYIPHDGSYDDSICRLAPKLANCVATVYLEEGYLSHGQLHFRPRLGCSRFEFQPVAGFIVRKRRFSFKSPRCLAIHPDAFAFIPGAKREIMSNFADLRGLYRPVLRDHDSVFLLNRPSCIRALESSAKQLNINNAERPLFLKVHPSWTINQMQILHQQMDQLRTKFNVTILPSRTILELEMSIAKIRIFGINSSLKLYADLFGADYIVRT